MRLLPAILAAALVGWLALPPAILNSDCRELGVGVHADPGEALLHRVKPRFSQEASAHMPLTSLWATQTCRHSGPLAFKFRLALSLAAPCLLILILGRLLGSPWTAVLALAPIIPAVWSASFTLQWIYAAFVLLVAAVLVWRAQAPSLWKSLFLGLAVGISLLYRSALVFFPPLLVLYEGIFPYRYAWKTYWRHALLILLTPYLLLLPWITMNWAEHRRFIPLENGEADCIVMTGAIGLVRSTLGDCRSLRSESSLSQRGGALRWAVTEVFKEPLRYAKACAARFLFVVSIRPYLFLAFLLAFWLLRRREDMRPLVILTFYFLVVHCLLAIQPHYFIPLWPILSVIASLALTSSFPALSHHPRPSVSPIADYGLKVFILIACGLSSLAIYHVTAYWNYALDERLSLDSRLDEALAHAPQDSWLLSERGRRKFTNGEIDSAMRDFSKALSLDPAYERYLDLARALALKGMPAPLLISPAFSDANSYPHHNALFHILRALVRLDHGNEKIAQEELALAQAVLAPRPPEGRIGSSSPEKKVMAAMTAASNQHFNELMGETLQLLPDIQRQKLLKSLQSLYPEDGLLLIQLAEIAAGKNEKKTALDLIKRAERQNLGSQEQLRVIALYQQLDDLGRARRALDALASRLFGDANLKLMQAQLALETNRPADALQALAQAERLRLDRHVALRLAQLYKTLGYNERALHVLNLLSRKYPERPEIWVALAESAKELRRFDSALAALDRAQSSRPEPRLQLQMARLYETLGHPKRALQLAELIEQKNIRNPEVLIPLADIFRRLHSPSRALTTLNKTIPHLGRKSPLLNQAAMLYCDLERPEQALALLDLLGMQYADSAAWFHLANSAHRAGRRGMTLLALTRIRSLKLAFSQQLETVTFYRKLGDTGSSQKLLKELIRSSPREPSVWIEQARLAIVATDKPLALRSLSQAIALHPPDSLRREMALIYQEIKEYSLCLRLWDTIISEGPPQASDLSNRGLCHRLNGAMPQAAADLEKAIRLDPGFLPAYLTLGSLHEAQGRRDQALELYRRALALPPRDDMRPLRQLIEKSLAQSR